jgi:hypothetical protein
VVPWYREFGVWKGPVFLPRATMLVLADFVVDFVELDPKDPYELVIIEDR